VGPTEVAALIRRFYVRIVDLALPEGVEDYGPESECTQDARIVIQSFVYGPFIGPKGSGVQGGMLLFPHE